MRLSIELAPEAGQLKHVRRLVSDWAEAVDVPQDSLPLIATELVSNAIAANPPTEPVVVWLDREGDEAHLSVMDGGAGMERTDEFPSPPPTAVRGRGLAIVDSLADRLEIERTDGCTVVTACTRIANW